METKINDFHEDLAYSEEASEEEFWDAIYRKAFPDMISHMPCPCKGPGQKLGIDRVIQLISSKTLYIDEKKRRDVWDDVLLEYLSNDKTGALGWIEKPLAIDYIAYAFMPTKKCLLLPWQELRRAWYANREHWKQKYSIPPAQNMGYKTWNIAVPIPVLQAALDKAALIQL